MNALVQDPIAWVDVGAVTDVPVRGARRVPTPSGPVAIFRTGDGQVFARVRSDGKTKRIEFAADVDAAFVDEAAALLAARYEKFLADRSAGKN